MTLEKTNDGPVRAVDSGGPQAGSRRAFLKDTLNLAGAAATVGFTTSNVEAEQATAATSSGSTAITPENPKAKARLVCQGGGIYGIGLVGAASVLETRYDWLALAGTSAGAIVAALLAAGYTTGELHEILNRLDFSRFKDAPKLNIDIAKDHAIHIPEGDPLFRLYRHLGINPGTVFVDWLTPLLADKGVDTFKDLERKDIVRKPSDPFSTYKLYMIATDISRARLLVLPDDIKDYQQEDGTPYTPDTLKVAEAVRMSISIPFFFEPVMLKLNGSKDKCIIMDGGVTSNFPIALFDNPSDLNPSAPTFGLRFEAAKQTQTLEYNKQLILTVDQEVVGYNPIWTLPLFYHTMTQGWDNRFAEPFEDSKRVAHIDLKDETLYPALKGVTVTSFDLTAEQKSQLFLCGRAAAGPLLNYDHAKWVQRFLQ
jgi:NTE family protein